MLRIFKVKGNEADFASDCITKHYLTSLTSIIAAVAIYLN
jgi:hypothetical protein